MSTNDSVSKGRESSIKGFANEHIAVGILMKKYSNVSLVDLPLSSYDLIIVIDSNDRENIIRAQVKTATRSISFTGGTRGGVDRSYKSGVKEYTQNSKTSDVVIGVYQENRDNSYHLYFIPTILIEMLSQKSISLSRIEHLKDDYDILEKCKDRKYIENIYRGLR